MKRKKKWQRTAEAVLATCLLISTSGITLAADGEKDKDSKDLGIQVEVGFNGAVLINSWAPVKVTVENTGDDFTGHLVLTKDVTYGGNIRSSFEKEIVLPKGTSKRFTLNVPGDLLQESVVLQIRNTDGEIVESKSNLGGSPIQEGILVGGLVENKDDLDMLTLVNSPSVGGKVTPKSLDADDLPDRAELLNGLDLLVINHAPKEQLTAEQIAAIEKWVNGGGHLLLSGGADYQGGAGQFAKLSPVQVTGTKELTDLSALQTYAGTQPNTTQLTVSTGTLDKNARALIMQGDLPVLAVRDIGAGQVLYAAYNIGAEPLTSWQGNKELWGKALTQLDIDYQSNSQYITPQMHQKAQIQGDSSLFKSITPSVLTSAAVLGSYVLVIGPLLFIALRRFNKREWGWVLIPGTAVVWALGIYLVGTDDRSGDGITQVLSVVDLKNENTAMVHTGASFVINNGGDYSVKLASGMQAMVTYNSMGGSNTSLPAIQQDGDHQRISFEDVEFWSTRSMYSEGVLQGKGTLKSDLHVNKAGDISGTVINNTKFDLDNAHLLIGNDLVKIGDLKQGESAKIDQKMASQVPNASGVTRRIHDAFAPFNPVFMVDDGYRLHRSLLGFGVRPGSLGSNAVHLYAFSQTPLDIVSLEKLTSQEDNYLSFVHQELSLTYDDLGTEKPFGLIRGKLTAREGNVNEADEGLYLQIGAATIEYNVKLSPDFVPQKVSTNLDQAAYAMFEKELYNWKTGAWDTVSKENTPTMSGDQLQKYVAADGKLLIRVKGTTPHDHFLQIPNVGVEGKVSQ